MATDPHQFSTGNAFTKKIYRDVYPAVNPTSAALSQAGKVVMITGASRGIGRHGLSDAFALAGAKGVIITARKLEALKETEANIKKANPDVQVLPLALEITDESSVKAAFEAIKAKFGVVDVLVNNAGLGDSAGHFLRDEDVATWWADFEVNVRGTKLVTSYFLRLLGKERVGTIVFLTSGLGLITLPGSSGYSITKLSDLQLASYAAAENDNVTAVAFHPGIVDTAMTTEFWKPYAKDTPELAGAVVVWLSTPAARFLSGRYTTTNWDVVELMQRKDEIVEKDYLKVKLSGDFGSAEYVR